MTSPTARALVWAAGLLVPRVTRPEWKEEWDGELAALEEARAGGALGLPSPMGYAFGAFAHALWMRTEGWTVDSMFQDIKYSTRVLRKSPGFTLVATLTLALGIGANASIFSLVNGVMFRAPDQILEPGRLVQIARSYESAPRWDNFSWPAMRMIQAEAGAFSGIAGFSREQFILGRGTDTEQVVGQLVTGNYFEVLGVRASIGRLLQPTDDMTPGGHPVVVLSHELWHRRYSGDPSVVGSTIAVGTAPYEVLGVAPEGFVGVENLGAAPSMWVPVAQHPGWFGMSPFDQWGWSWVNLVGRLDEGATFQEARASMDVVQFRLREAYPANEDIEVLLAEGIGLDPEERTEAKQMAFILTLIVGVVLLLTCTNVANLFLARATARRGEVGVRMALGAGRGRLARQTLTESLILALLATTVAAPIVLSAETFLPLIFPFGLTGSVAPDARVLGFLVSVGIAAGLLLGAVPAWASSRRGVTEALRDAKSTGGRTKTRLQDFLVISQLGLSLGLVAGAALLGRSVMNARSAQPGFDPTGLVVGYMDLDLTGRYDEEAGLDLWNRLVTSAARIPGVQSATLANQTPIVGGHSRRTVRPAGRNDVEFEAESIVVGGDYFQTLGIPLLRGPSTRRCVR
ncbi:MAG: ABC transporter permease [Gemmatimonadetes bacterium]|nr:ABC transporter permease [Gemmatimonadota bacterium]